jgi:hypothetical protein
MSDFDFESRLERLFSQPPAVTDPGVFTARVQARLERGWGLRQLVIGAAGVVGGTVAATQAFGSGLLHQLESVRMPVGPMLAEVSPDRLLRSDILGSIAGGGEVMWMAVAMAALTVAFAATRFADAF